MLHRMKKMPPKIIVTPTNRVRLPTNLSAEVEANFLIIRRAQTAYVSIPSLNLLYHKPESFYEKRVVWIREIQFSLTNFYSRFRNYFYTGLGAVCKPHLPTGVQIFSGFTIILIVESNETTTTGQRFVSQKSIR